MPRKRGFKTPQSVKDKISKTLLTRGTWNKGKKTGIIPKTAFKKGIITWNKGKKTGIITKGAFKRGVIPWNKGLNRSNAHVIRSDEWKRKISESHKGKKFTKEHIENIRLSKLGTLASEETKKKMSNSQKGRKHSEESKKKISEKKKGSVMSSEQKEKLRLSHLGKKQSLETIEKRRLKVLGEKHWRWKKDRNTLVKRQERNDSAYAEWRKNVYLRDGFKCRISTCDCNGRIEAHHILAWSEFPELRYNINNGITLCRFHHPRKKVDEKTMIPFFKELVSDGATII